MRRFLVRLAEQRELVWMAAARAWREPADAGRRRRADRALGAAVKRMGRETARDAVVGPVVQMARRVALALHQEPDEAALEELAEPALAAALAVLVSDELSADVLMALYEPFDGAIPLAELLDESESPTG
ncbi:MAG TPA: hypothetical protein VFY16_03150 [Gemmatimonadaceae bacterium]|nr:hypothetical protein [Gemmatimonadaceae bacterium]